MNCPNEYSEREDMQVGWEDPAFKCTSMEARMRDSTVISVRHLHANLDWRGSTPEVC